MVDQYEDHNDVYIEVNEVPTAPTHLLKCHKNFTSPISHSQLSYECCAPIARNTPENNRCNIIDYRGVHVASFCVDNKLLICLPQAFDLFLKHLVGGLHTVYTKLKRLDIVPVVCNVEQVRILRGLGAIQPGVNRCKLIAPNQFDTLYEDCTNSGSRPGRPPKRVNVCRDRESECAEEPKKNLDQYNQLASFYFSSFVHTKKAELEENSCKNLIKSSDFCSVKSNYRDEYGSSASNASSPTSSSSSSRLSVASELIKCKNPLSVENLIRKDDEQKPTSQAYPSASLIFLNQQLIHRVECLTTSLLVLESNLRQTKQNLQKSLLNERNMRIKYEARIRNLVKLRQLMLAKNKYSNKFKHCKLRKVNK
ncbi:dachshund -like protein [Brachionus plicatilis]|uniref:Dachshund-like protein n=1 Tax=Brachionus plicatilis TaxID=10195 RepID=A0A3M7R122_BRAPC|nr:dachshund -like protein [Brachionus plicatilis]